MNQDFLGSSKKWDWETPSDKFKMWDKIFGFTLDVAANERNAKCPAYISEEMDAFKTPWITEGKWWLNCPWGKAYKKATGLTIYDWMKRALQQFREGNEGVAIVSARTETDWFQDNCVPAPHRCFLKRRVNFINPDTGKPGKQPTFPSVLVIYIRHLTDKQIAELNRIGDLVQTVKPLNRR
jgi:phage N-6-adenine-methyltransferase